MMEEFSNCVKNKLGGFFETPPPSARGGKQQYDQQTAPGESVVGGWNKAHESAGNLASKPHFTNEAGYGISPDPSSLMEELQFGKRMIVPSTELQSKTKVEGGVDSNIIRPKLSGESNFDFGDDEPSENAHPKVDNVGMFSNWEKTAVVEQPPIEHQVATSEPIPTNTVKTTPSPPGPTLDQKPVEDTKPVQEPAAIDPSVHPEPIQEKPAVTVLPDPELVTNPSKPIEASNNITNPQNILTETPKVSTTTSPLVETIKENQGAGNLEQQSEQTTAADVFDRFESEFVTKVAEKKQADPSKPIVVETGGNPNKISAPDQFDFGTVNNAGFKKKNTKTQVNAIVTDFFGTQAPVSNLDSQGWIFGADSQDKQTGPAAPVQPMTEFIDPFAAFSFDTNEQIASGSQISQDAPISTTAQTDFFFAATLESTPNMDKNPIPEPLPPTQQSAALPADPFADFAFGEFKPKEAAALQQSEQTQNEDIREEPRNNGLFTEPRNELPGSAVIEELASIPEESREESQLGLNLGPEASNQVFGGNLEEPRISHSEGVAKPDKNAQFLVLDEITIAAQQTNQGVAAPQIEVKHQEIPIREESPSLLDSSDLPGFPAFDQVKPEHPTEPIVQPLKKQDSDIFADIKFPTFTTNLLESPEKVAATGAGSGAAGGFLSQIEPTQPGVSEDKGSFPMFLPLSLGGEGAGQSSAQGGETHSGQEPTVHNTLVMSSRLGLNESAFEAASESLIAESDTMIVGIQKGPEETKQDLGQILPPPSPVGNSPVALPNPAPSGVLDPNNPYL